MMFGVILILLMTYWSVNSQFNQERPVSCALDCQDVYDLGFNKSGVYNIKMDEIYDGLDVYCDMTTDGGGWLVFQRREDGSVNFTRSWDEYQFGFGYLSGEHWLGNLALHIITMRGFYELRVDLEDWEGNKRFAKYGVFRVKHAEELYKLVVGGYMGDAGDSMDLHNGMAFSTYEHDNDVSNDRHCAKIYKGGYWYEGCHRSNVNGLYLKGGYDGNAVGVDWRTWKGYGYSLKKVSMKIRRLDYRHYHR